MCDLEPFSEIRSYMQLLYIDIFTQNFNTYDHHTFIDILWQEFKVLVRHAWT